MKNVERSKGGSIVGNYVLYQLNPAKVTEFKLIHTQGLR